MKPVTREQAVAVITTLASNVDWDQLDGEVLQDSVVTKAKSAGEQFTAFLRNGAVLAVSPIFRLAVNIERDVTDWTCVEPVEAEGDFEPSLCEFLKEGKTRIGGEEMVRRAKKQGVQSGLRHAEAMLRNQERIPVEWRKFILVFPEVWQDPYGNRNVWYLNWNGGRWFLFYNWLGSGFFSDYRLVSSRKY